MLKIKKSFYLWAAATFLCMSVIFWFSSQNADESGELSGNLAHFIESLVRTSLLGDILEIILRKSAHIFIYSLLGFCSAFTLRQIIQDKQCILMIALFFCIIYATTDELHQYFVPGRACMWQDLLIDTVGSLLGIGAAFTIFSIKRRG